MRRRLDRRATILIGLHFAGKIGLHKLYFGSAARVRRARRVEGRSRGCIVILMSFDIGLASLQIRAALRWVPMAVLAGYPDPRIGLHFWVVRVVYRSTFGFTYSFSLSE